MASPGTAQADVGQKLQATLEGGEDDVDRQLAQLGDDGRVDAELAKMKASSPSRRRLRN